jgi:DNA-binding PadR family transcriptional regulator
MKQASVTRLLVLGVVKIQQPIHGYEVRRTLVQWGAADWASVLQGSVYGQLGTLARDGLLEVTDADPPADRPSNRPARTSYRLTDTGEGEFVQLLRQALWTVDANGAAVMAGLCFMNHLTRDEVMAALESRAHQIDGVERSMSYWRDDAMVYKPGHVREVFEVSASRLRAEAEWARTLHARLRAGDYVFAGEPAAATIVKSD